MSIATAAEAPTSTRAVRNAHGSETVRSRRFKRSYRTLLRRRRDTAAPGALPYDRLVPTRIHFIGGDLAIDVTESFDELQNLLAVTGHGTGLESHPRAREQDLRQARGDRLLVRSAPQETPASDWA
jgi:hypothetical protein